MCLYDLLCVCSGIRPEDLVGAPSFETARERVAELLAGKVLVGHALHHDLEVLGLDHPNHQIRDTALFFTLQGQSRSLKILAERLLKEEIQTGRHSSVEDARVPVLLYTKFRWVGVCICVSPVAFLCPH